jgi:Zn-dependent peptidase ImmA (M78 family)
MNFSRMDLADCATPESLLAAIHKLQNGVFPIPIPVEEWAAALDIVAIEAMETEGFEGGLMMFADRSSASILVNKHNDERRRRFTVGHELGHFLLPWHSPRNGQAFQCSRKDMAIFLPTDGIDRYIRMEAEANRFSAGFLMPAAPFRIDLRARRNFEVTHIAELADRYFTSKEATARRCADLHDEPTGIVVSRDHVVVRSYSGKNFPWIAARAKQPVPAGSLTRRSALAQGECSSWAEMPADVWLEGARGTVYEQVLGQRDGFRLTLLTFEAEGDDSDEDELVEKAWEQPTFKRR